MMGRAFFSCNPNVLLPGLSYRTSSLAADVGVERQWATYERLQAEAAARPGSLRVTTPHGPIWMSPIEARLYEAMVRAGLLPMPQYCIKGYFADFAFPSVLVAVEADGAFHQTAENLARDRWRDWILRRAGWTVFRFHGTTINDRADNCAFVVHREVQGRWDRIQAEAQYLEAERRAQTQYLEARRLAWKKALRHPFRTVLRYLRGSRIPSPAPAHPPPPKPP